MRTRERLIGLACVAALTIVIATPASSEGTERVLLKSSAVVTGETVLLSDVLPENSPADVKERAGGVVLGKAPPPGHVRVIARAAVEEKLQVQGDLIHRLVIPERIAVRRTGRRISREEVLNSIRNTLVKNGFAEANNLTAADVQLDAVVQVSQEDAGLEVTRMDFDPLLRRARFRLWASREKSTLPFFATAHLPLLSQALATSGAFRLAGKERPAGTSFRPPGEELQTAAFSVQPGLALIRPMRAPNSPVLPVLVEPGRKVTLVLRSSRVQIRLPAMPIERGVRGQRIRVRVLANGKILRAEVIARGELALPF
jgi:hypothetical protein